MPPRTHTLEVLAVQIWIRDPAPLRAAIRSAGFLARIKRVDIEPALHAALGRQAWDLVVFDREPPILSLTTLRQAMRSHRCKAPLVVIEDGEVLVESVRRALKARRS